MSLGRFSSATALLDAGGDTDPNPAKTDVGKWVIFMKDANSVLASSHSQALLYEIS
jgi:hypothetical protein